jgi:hypothetical protein
MLAFVDTMVLVWGIRQEADETNQARIQQARAFFEDMEQKGLHIGVAAPSLAEYLVRTPDTDRNRVFREFSRLFTVYPFDAAAAHQAAESWNIVHGRTPARRVAESFGMDKATLSVDHQIVSIAVCRKADLFITHDAKCQSYARRFLPRVEELPQAQQTLPFVNLGAAEAAAASDWIVQQE